MTRLKRQHFYLVALAYTALTVGITSFRSSGYPLWEFLTGPNDRFRDLYVQLSIASRIETVQFVDLETLTRGVFPVAILIYGHLGGVVGMSNEQSVVIYNVMVVTLLIVGVTMAFKSWSVRFLVLCSYPVWFGFFRGNNELLVFSLFLIGWVSAHSRKKQGVIVAGIGQLIEPSLHFFLLRKYLDRAVLTWLCVVSAVTILLASLLVPGESPWTLLIDLTRFVLTQGQVNDLFRTTHNISPMSGIIAWTQVVSGPQDWMSSSTVLGLVQVALVVLLLTLIVLVAVRRAMPFLDITIIVCALALILPMYSYAYRTIWLLFPLGMLLELPAQEFLLRHRLLQTCLIMLVIVPKPWFVWLDPLSGGQFYESSLIDPVLVVALLATTLASLPTRSRNPDLKTPFSAVSHH